MTTKHTPSMPQHNLSASIEEEQCRLDGPGTYAVLAIHGCENRYGDQQIVLRTTAGSYPGDGVMNIVLSEIAWRVNTAPGLVVDRAKLVKAVQEARDVLHNPFETDNQSHIYFKLRALLCELGEA